MLVRGALLGSHPRADERELCLRLLYRRAVGETAEDRDTWPCARATLVRGETHRHPQLVRDGKLEALRHYADDCRERVVDLHAAADYAAIAREARAPDFIAEHHDRWSTGQ